MAFDRILKVDLDTAIRLTEPFKWKFYERNGNETLRVEIPRNGDNIVFELPDNPNTIKKLKAEGFIEQEIKPWRQY